MASACSVSSSLQLPSIPFGGGSASSSRKNPFPSNRGCQCGPAAAVRGQGPAAAQLQCSTILLERRNECSSVINRRDALGIICGWMAPLCLLIGTANAAGLPPEEKPRLCDTACEKELENVAMVTTESGLQYKDIKVGSGPSPPVGYQVAANYVAMVPSGQIFDSSLEKGQVYIFRVGSGQVIKGLDEGLLTMKAGGKRRLFIPGPLAFPRGLTSAPGRPRVAANSPVVFDVSLEYIPGLEIDDEEEE